MLQNARFTAFTIFELLRENQRGGGGENYPLPPPMLGLKEIHYFFKWPLHIFFLNSHDINLQGDEDSLKNIFFLRRPNSLFF